MSADPGNAATEPGAFSVRAGLLLVSVGVALFVALLWMIGTGYGFDNSNDGGSHAGGRGLNGFAGLFRLAAAEGWEPTLARNDPALNQPGLLVLTPTADAPGKEIARIVNRHRRIGPVMVIAPKWVVQRLSSRDPGARDGWVALVGVQPPVWPGFLDRVSVAILAGAKNGAGLAGAKGVVLRWRAAGAGGQLPNANAVEVGGGADDAGRPLVPLVWVDGGVEPVKSPMLAAYVATARRTPQLERLALDGQGAAGSASVSTDYPLVLVFEPDLLDNAGLADPANAALASRLLSATAPDGPRAITFDLTLNGLGHAPNLLTLAFTLPYVAATLCLIVAALAAGWRSFCRFGAPRAATRELAFGKAPLVANAGALILRARRLHLLGPPYANASRERIARALALPRHAEPAQTDAAIDRALLARRDGSSEPARGFGETIRDLHQAHGETAIVAAARALHQLERMLIR
jgi:hypothetical protein